MPRGWLRTAANSVLLLEELLADEPAAAAGIEALRQLGISIAIDDFAAGHSSLTRLIDFAPDVLKLDKSLSDRVERDNTDRAVIETIRSLADQVGSLTVAEGVETIEQLRILTQLGVTHIQGWLFERAITEDELMERLRTPDRYAHVLDPLRQHEAGGAIA